MYAMNQTNNPQTILSNHLNMSQVGLNEKEYNTILRFIGVNFYYLLGVNKSSKYVCQNAWKKFINRGFTQKRYNAKNWTWRINTK